MKDKSKVITASEINKYLYCPYQWYYERVYGTKQIREMVKQRNAEFKQKDPTKSNFVRGLAFHKNYRNQQSMKKRLQVIFAFAILILVLFVYLFFIKEPSFWN